MFNKFTKTVFVCTALLLPTSVAFASSDAVSAEQEAKVRSSLTEQGYEVRKIKMEDGMFEAYAIKDGKKVEIYLDNNMNIVKTKSDD